MQTPGPLVECERGPITWTDDPNEAVIKHTLAKKGYDIKSLEKKSMSRYTMQQSLGSSCSCGQHTITVNKGIMLQSCRCNVQVLGVPPDEMTYETSPNHHHLRYNREKARPIRVPEGYKFIGLRSDTGTGKNYQIDVLLRALLYGECNRYHTEAEQLELENLRTRIGPEPGVVFIGPRTLYDIEMVRKLKHHGAQLYKDMEKYDEAPIWVWQFHSLRKFDKKVPKILVIDEAELNRKVFTDSLNKTYQHSNQGMLEVLIENADLVVVTDATLSEDTIGVLSKIDPKGKWFIQGNTFQSNAGVVVRSHDTLESIMNRCVVDLIAGKVLAVPSGSLSKLDKFRDEVISRLPENIRIKYKTFNSKTPGREKDFVKGLDEALGVEFTMLLYTASMGVGVEYTLEHVDKRYLLVNYNLVGADGYLQLLGRVRSPKNKTVEMFISKSSRKQSEWLPTTRDAVKRQIDDEIKANTYIKQYYSPYMEPSTRKIIHQSSKPWVEEALIINTIQRNRSLNNMEDELFTLLQATGYTIENVHDEGVERNELSCEAINMDTEEADVVTSEQRKLIEEEINILSYNEQLELNLRHWSMYIPSLNEEETLRKKYVRYRVDFPHEAPTMETCKLIDHNRDVLYNLSCVYKLADQSELYNYLIRDNQNIQSEHIYKQLTAMKILFGALTGTKNRAAGAQMTPPDTIDGRVIEENMQQILAEIHNTGLPRLVGIRVRNNELKKNIQLEERKMVKPVMGLVNQATKRMFGFTYVSSARTRSEGRQYGTWDLTPAQLISGLSIVDVARRSALCTDTDTPGHPRVPTPMEE
jgi:hypothetical protein